MGLDLTLLPVEGGETTAFAHTNIGLDRDSDLFELILRVELEKGEPVPSYFGTYLCRDKAYEESHYGNTQTIPYGNDLLCVEAQYLYKIASHCEDGISQRNEAAMLYLSMLDSWTRIALYWH